jgi:hypothetical protein
LLAWYSSSVTILDHMYKQDKALVSAFVRDVGSTIIILLLADLFP